MKQKTGTEELGAPWCMGLGETTLRRWLGVGGGADSAEGARGRGDSRQSRSQWSRNSKEYRVKVVD